MVKIQLRKALFLTIRLLPRSRLNNFKLLSLIDKVKTM